MLKASEKKQMAKKKKREELWGLYIFLMEINTINIKIQRIPMEFPECRAHMLITGSQNLIQYKFMDLNLGWSWAVIRLFSFLINITIFWLSLGPDFSASKPFLLFQNLSTVLNFPLFSVPQSGNEKIIQSNSLWPFKVFASSANWMEIIKSILQICCVYAVS